MVHTDEPRVGEERSHSDIEKEALGLLLQARRDGIIKSDDLLRMRQYMVMKEIRGGSGYWDQTFDELEYGIRLSWKHARKCIMRSEYMCLRYVRSTLSYLA